MRRPRVLVVGSGAREHVIAATLARSEAPVYVAGPWVNPGLRALARDYLVIPLDRAPEISQWARSRNVELAVLGPEAAIAAGGADALRKAGIPTVGPGQRAGQIETSKAFARQLMERHEVPGLPRYRSATSEREIDEALDAMPQDFVVKPSGLTGGKGVWVGGVDFTTREEGRRYAKSLLDGGGTVVLEERLDGEEFSLMAFVDGTDVFPMPVVQDYKRALEGNQGRNTGGMGSYSERGFLLPFLSQEDQERAVGILTRTVRALREEGLEYRGILYGGFMLTQEGPKVLEFNARFGDPEALNVLTLFDGTDFADLLFQLATGRIDPAHVEFRRRATVVKYLVPPGYGDRPRAGGVLRLDVRRIQDLAVSIYYGSVTPGTSPGEVVLGTSRGVALVGESSAIWEAEARVEEALPFVTGEYYIRHDIAKASDIKARVDHIQRLKHAPPFDPMRNPTRSGPAPPPVFFA